VYRILWDDHVSTAEHWDQIYSTKAPTTVSWYQDSPVVALQLMAEAGIGSDRRVVDVGAGASRLADELFNSGFDSLVLADVSHEALAHIKQRLAESAAVTYVVGDVRDLDVGAVDVWHDRAVFHFLTDAEDRGRYRESVARNLAAGGHAIIATFAPDGPEYCSGLSTARYSAQELSAQFAGLLSPVTSRREVHVTPDGREQAFTYVLLVRDA
jgi:SAM-dependent methyltransferase